MERQLATLDFAPTFQMGHPIAFEFAERLAEIAPLYACRGNGDDGSGGRPRQPDHPCLADNQLLELGAHRREHLHHGRGV